MPFGERPNFSVHPARSIEQFDRLTGNFGKAGGEPGMLQCRHSHMQCLNIFCLHYFGNLRGGRRFQLGLARA